MVKLLIKLNQSRSLIIKYDTFYSFNYVLEEIKMSQIRSVEDLKVYLTCRTLVLQSLYIESVFISGAINF